MLSEHTIGQDTPICAGEERIRNVYVSKTSSVDVMLIQAEVKRHFLIKYESKCS